MRIITDDDVKLSSQQLVSAKEMHKQFPETFELPSKEDYKFIKRGVQVKVALNNESFWCTIAGKWNLRRDTWIGVIENDLQESEPVNFGDAIYIHKNNIFLVSTPEVQAGLEMRNHHLQMLDFDPEMVLTDKRFNIVDWKSWFERVEYYFDEQGSLNFRMKDVK